MPNFCIFFYKKNNYSFQPPCIFKLSWRKGGENYVQISSKWTFPVLKMDSSYPKMVPKWTLPDQNGLFKSQNGLFWSLNGPKMDSSGPKMDSSVSQMDSSSPKIVPLLFLSSLKVVFQMSLEIVFCWCYSSANSKENCSKCNLIFSSYRGWKKASE